MDLTTIARVKLLLQPQQNMGTSVDSTLSQIIANVSRAAEIYCDRAFEWKARTEDFDVEEDDIFFKLRAWPARTAAEAFTNIASVTVYNDTARAFSTALDSSLYAINNRRGILIFDKYEPMEGPQVLRVTYTGGLNSSVTSAATFVSAFPDIAHALEVEVVRNFMIGPSPHATTISYSGVNIGIVSDTGFLPSTRMVLDKYKRMPIG